MPENEEVTESFNEGGNPYTATTGADSLGRVSSRVPGAVA